MPGTSGFSYPHWRDSFYPRGMPQSRWLEAYAERFCSVELNVSFYRLPRIETFEDWARRTPDDFEFVVKGSRTITHYRRLRDAEIQVDALLDRCRGLGPKLSCVLWQLPPRIAPDLVVLDRFCELVSLRTRHLARRDGVRHAFEFRDERWFEPAVFDVLHSHGCALVLADPGSEGQPRDRLTADFAYVRFHHGPRENGSYAEDELIPWAERARRWLHEGHDVYAYFNNDPGAWAPRNAEEFSELVGVPALSAG